MRSEPELRRARLRGAPDRPAVAAVRTSARSALVAAAGVLLLCVASSLLAQEANAPTADASAAGEPLREKTVYVPYDKLAEVFEKEGRGIFLPYHEFLELWERAQPKPEPEPDVPPPAEAVISGGIYKGEVVGEVASFDVEYRIVALKKKGWSTLALPIRNAAVEEATITAEGVASGAAAVAATALAEPPLLVAEADHYNVHLPSAGAYRVRLRLSVRVDVKPGRRTLSFGIPPAAVSQLDLLIPEADAQLDVEPLMAATKVEEKDGKTRLLAFVGNSSSVSVSWSPPAGAVEREAALIIASQVVRTYLGERVLRVATDVRLDILRQEIDRVRVRMPRDMEVFSVNGENIREWTVERGEGEASDNILEVRLHVPVQKVYALRLEFERILDETPTSIDIPFPRVEGVLRESGYVALSHDKGLRVRVARSEGLSQQDLGELPQSLRQGTFVGFRYLAHPLELGLEVEKILPVIHAESASVVVFGVEEDAWVGWIDYKVTRSGVFALTFRVPSRWRVGEIGDESIVEDYQSAAVGNEPDVQEITVNLRNRAFGDFRLPFRFIAPGSASAGDKTLVAPRAVGVQSDRGLLGVGGPRAFRIATGPRANMIAADAQELFKSGVRSRVPQDVNVDLAFTFHDHPASVTVTLEERKTEIKVNSRILVNVTNTAIQVAQDLEYLVQFAAADTISFSAPSAFDDRIQIEVAGERDRKKAPAGDGRTRWDISLQSRLLGVKTVKVSYEIGLEDLETGVPKSVPLPHIRAEGADAEQGAVAIRKEGALEVRETVTGLEDIDSRELPPELARGRIYGAYSFAQPAYSMALELTRQDYVEVPEAIVSLLVARCHLSRERILDTDAVLVIENAARQYIDIRFPKGARNVRFFVNGEEAVPQRVPRVEGDTSAAAEEDLRIPLRGALGSVVARCRYQVGDGAAMGSTGTYRLATPRVLGGLPVEKIEVELHAPSEYVYFFGGGTLYLPPVVSADTWTWMTTSAFSNVAARRRPIGPRSAWGGVAMPELPTEFTRGDDTTLFRLQTYQPEGTASFRFLALRHYTVCNVLLFIVAIAAGIVAVRRWRAERWWILVGASAVLLLFAWLSSPAAAVLWLSCYRAGVVLIVLLAAKELAPRVRDRYRSWREDRIAMRPDPFLEEAELEPAKPLVEPAKKPAAGGDASDEETDNEASGDSDTDDDDASNANEDAEASKRRRSKRKKEE